MEYFIDITWSTAAQVVMLGFIGGILSGFIGSGGAFFMTPGMMNLGVLGPVSVASNITHKFGKAMVGSKRHSELGNVDKKLSIFMLITAALGIRLAVMVMKFLFEGKEGHSASTSAGADLYISLVFVIVLTIVSLSMLRDINKSRKNLDKGPSRKIVEFLSKHKLPPIIYFPVADISVSLWVVLIVGLACGYLAGTIGVGGFIGVPAMIYVFGASASVAAGSELYLAMYMGAFGAINYAFEGLVDIRLTLLLFVGSLFGIYIGAYGTKVVKEVSIRLVTAVIILLCVISRFIAIPVYLQQLSIIDMKPAYNDYFNLASKAMLYLSGISGGLLILYYVFKAYFHRRKIQASFSAEYPLTIKEKLAEENP
ncbi:MAG: sulfite exporter TauE/SafE family protein [Ignavibacteriaceae bacterium]|nr:sulfite exporter TauE/SafE family protein [Ignavibacteriaceae bacterium]